MSSYVIAAAEALAAASEDLSGIGSTIMEANTAAAAWTTERLAAGQDEVSAAIAALFSVHAEQYRALSAQAAAFHTQFMQTLGGGGGVCGG